MSAREFLDAYAYREEFPRTGFRGNHAPKAFAALRAVLDLHKPQQAARMVRCAKHRDWMRDPLAECPGDCPDCESIPFQLCTCDREYPCADVRAIEEALKP